MGAVYRAILDRIEARDYDVFSSVVRVPRPRRALIALRPPGSSDAGRAMTAAPDVVVVGAGFAGLSAAAVLAEAGKRVLVLDARPQLGGRATAFTDRVTGELVDNGQHVLFGCYHETFAFLRRIGAEANIRLQSDDDGPVPRSCRAAGRSCAARRCRRRCICSAESCAGRVAAGRSPLGPQDGRTVDVRRKAIARDPAAVLAADAMTVSRWLQRAGQASLIREWLWDPLAVAALNQAPDDASATTFVRVLAELFGPRAADCALALPAVPLHEVYACRHEAFIAARGRRGADQCAGAPVVGCRALAVSPPRRRARRSAVDGAGHRRRPWFALGALVGSADAPALTPSSSARQRWHPSRSSRSTSGTTHP